MVRTIWPARVSRRFTSTKVSLNRVEPQRQTIVTSRSSGPRIIWLLLDDLQVQAFRHHQHAVVLTEEPVAQLDQTLEVIPAPAVRSPDHQDVARLQLEAGDLELEHLHDRGYGADSRQQVLFGLVKGAL